MEAGGHFLKFNPRRHRQKPACTKLSQRRPPTRSRPSLFQYVCASVVVLFSFGGGGGEGEVLTFPGKVLPHECYPDGSPQLIHAHLLQFFPFKIKGLKIDTPEAKFLA